MRMQSRQRHGGFHAAAMCAYEATFEKSFTQFRSQRDVGDND